MNEDEKLKKIEEEEEELSLSEDVATRPHTSTESFKIAEKKKKKFKPGKFISKHLKIKKDEKRLDSGDNSEDSSTKSPKLGTLTRNIAKKFSRKKKSQVKALVDDEPLNNERDLMDVEKVSKKDSIIGNNLIGVLESSPKAVKVGESRKVQLQITISGKKIEKIEKIQPTVAIDKASVPLSYNKSQNDIGLPSSSTAAQINKMREEFLSVMVSRTENDDEKMQKLISHDTFSQSVSGSREKQSNFEPTEIYSSSLSSIVDLEVETVENLTIEESDEKDSEVSSLKVVKVEESLVTETVRDRIEYLNSPEKNLSIIRAEVQQHDDEMKKTKIPVKDNQRRASAEINPVRRDSTVRTQEAQPYHLSTSIDNFKDAVDNKSEEIKFEVGTAVRPQKILSVNSNVTPIIITETESESSNVNQSADDVFHSPKMEQLDKRDSKRRRKISYIPQLTIYTAEEQELLRSNIIANSESFDIPSLPPDSSIFPVFDDSLVRDILTRCDDCLPGL